MRATGKIFFNESSGGAVENERLLPYVRIRQALRNRPVIHTECTGSSRNGNIAKCELQQCPYLAIVREMGPWFWEESNNKKVWFSMERHLTKYSTFEKTMQPNWKRFNLHAKRTNMANTNQPAFFLNLAEWCWRMQVGAFSHVESYVHLDSF